MVVVESGRPDGVDRMAGADPACDDLCNSFFRDGNSLYQGERILVNKWSYGLRLPFCSLFGYHRLASSRAEKGDILLFNNPHPQQVEKGIEWRELFISRCIGTPGDTLMLDADLNCVGGEVLSPDAKSLYAYPVSSEDLMLTVLSVLGIKGNTLAGYTSDGGIYGVSANMNIT